MHTDRAATHWPPQVNNCFMGVRLKSHIHGSHAMAATVAHACEQWLVSNCFVEVRLQTHRHGSHALATKVTHARKMPVNSGLACPDRCKASKWARVFSWTAFHDSR